MASTAITAKVTTAVLLEFASSLLAELEKAQVWDSGPLTIQQQLVGLGEGVSGSAGARAAALFFLSMTHASVQGHVRH